tara:strand:+ start:11396 stop:11638 length:243 start_codon:yes stop_codon:yes gene_type:complete
MNKLYFIQYPDIDPTLDQKIKSLGRHMIMGKGWIVQSHLDAKSIHTFLTQHNSSITIVILGIDKTNYYGRYAKELWDLFN